MQCKLIRLKFRNSVFSNFYALVSVERLPLEFFHQKSLSNLDVSTLKESCCMAHLEQVTRTKNNLFKIIRNSVSHRKNIDGETDRYDAELT